MDVWLPILAGVAIAAFVVYVIRRVVRLQVRGADARTHARARRLRSDATFVIVGLLVMLLSVVVGRGILAVEEPPFEQRFKAGVGIAPAVRTQTSGGFVVGMATRFTGCDDPTRVTLAFVGTAEYFEANVQRLGGRTDFTIAVPGKGLKNVALAYGAFGAGGYRDALVPLLAQAGDWLSDGTVRMEAVEERNEVTSIRGTVDSWSSHLASLLVAFETDWLVDRGLGTCYLRLPPLTGLYSVLGSQDGLGRAARSHDELLTVPPHEGSSILDDTETLYAWYDVSLFTTNAFSVVDAGTNEVVDSEPPANTNSAGVPAVSCSQSPTDVGDLGQRRADLVRGTGDKGDKFVYAIRAGAIDRVGSHDCGGVVTLAEAGAESDRDLVLLLVGAVFSIGAALLLEVGMGRFRRESPSGGNPT